jgi:hypothetical protein
VSLKSTAAAAARGAGSAFTSFSSDLEKYIFPSQLQDMDETLFYRRLSNQLPDLYPTGTQLRSLQRRVKAWRAQWARQLVFANGGHADLGGPGQSVNHTPRMIDAEEHRQLP